MASQAQIDVASAQLQAAGLDVSGVNSADVNAMLGQMTAPSTGFVLLWWHWLLIILGGLAVILLIGFGIFMLMNKSKSSSSPDNSANKNNGEIHDVESAVTANKNYSTF